MRRQRNHLPRVGVLAAALVLVGCGTAPVVERTPRPVQIPAPVVKPPTVKKIDPSLPVLPPANSGRGGYYQDDGPGDAPPANLADTPDADVRNDPLLPRSNRPYTVFGKTYTPITNEEPFTQIGVGSWYGKKFHGQRTSSGELYDMYKMTAAHPTLPIPSYARLSNMVSGATVIVRINDRGPFHANRAIDVSYTAALKLGLLGKGSHELKIERILPEEIERILATREGLSGSTRPRLTPESKDRLPSSTPGASTPPPTPTVTAKMIETPLVLTPAAPAGATTVQASVPPKDIEALMLADRSPADYAAPATPGLAGGFYLQLGAYSRAENAEAMRSKLGGKFNLMEVVQGGAVFRLFGGPFATRQEAQQAAQGLPSTLGLKPIIVQR
ncbi:MULTISPECIES: septal ring lytic transglycosylase RlpA family protein [unclassified Duganella]|uniref:septal ring lytic transglycosylase RlpA family protein n=1 Tax=unclassified Duganella TaxID=2636909 RepID=UPI000891FBDF|nr:MULTISPECIES: septal ring lytic transglycosylase RlpA family protein [unclassified Duganella]SDG72619.1 rare lipoprotein A [Duganella sp. OV458]SDJ98773.1 rare lipoprotein A [Duganella sp. OV510]